MKPWKQALLVLGVFLVALFTLNSLFAVFAEEGASQRAASVKPKAAATPEAAEMARVEKKLAKILENQEELLKGQQTVLQKFDAVMEELRIIKVRSTRQ